MFLGSPRLFTSESDLGSFSFFAQRSETDTPLYATGSSVANRHSMRPFNNLISFGFVISAAMHQSASYAYLKLVFGLLFRPRQYAYGSVFSHFDAVGSET